MSQNCQNMFVSNTVERKEIDGEDVPESMVEKEEIDREELHREELQDNLSQLLLVFYIASFYFY